MKSPKPSARMYLSITSMSAMFPSFVVGGEIPSQFAIRTVANRPVDNEAITGVAVESPAFGLLAPGVSSVEAAQLEPSWLSVLSLSLIFFDSGFVC